MNPIPATCKRRNPLAATCGSSRVLMSGRDRNLAGDDTPFGPWLRQ